MHVYVPSCETIKLFLLIMLAARVPTTARALSAVPKEAPLNPKPLHPKPLNPKP